MRSLVYKTMLDPLLTSFLPSQYSLKLDLTFVCGLKFNEYMQVPKGTISTWDTADKDEIQVYVHKHIVKNFKFKKYLPIKLKHV